MEQPLHDEYKCGIIKVRFNDPSSKILSKISGSEKAYNSVGFYYRHPIDNVVYVNLFNTINDENSLWMTFHNQLNDLLQSGTVDKICYYPFISSRSQSCIFMKSSMPNNFSKLSTRDPSKDFVTLINNLPEKRTLDANKYFVPSENTGFKIINRLLAQLMLGSLQIENTKNQIIPCHHLNQPIKKYIEKIPLSVEDLLFYETSDEMLKNFVGGDNVRHSGSIDETVQHFNQSVVPLLENFTYDKLIDLLIYIESMRFSEKLNDKYIALQNYLTMELAKRKPNCLQ